MPTTKELIAEAEVELRGLQTTLVDLRGGLPLSDPEMECVVRELRGLATALDCLSRFDSLREQAERATRMSIAIQRCIPLIRNMWDSFPYAELEGDSVAMDELRESSQDFNRLLNVDELEAVLAAARKLDPKIE